MILGLMVFTVLYVLKSKNFHVSLFIMKNGDMKLRGKLRVADVSHICQHLYVCIGLRQATISTTHPYISSHLEG